MKTRLTRKSVCSTLILVTVFTMLLSALSFGATTRKKLIKSWKEYDGNGTLIYSTSRTFDSKGHVKTSSWYQFFDGKAESGKYTIKNTYWKGTSILKKVVEKSSNYTYTCEYTKKGAPKTSVYQSGDFYEKNVYKSSGKKIKSYITYDKNGRKTREATYDGRGNIKRHVFYSADGTSSWTNYATKYNKSGLVTKRTVTYSSGMTQVTTYDKKGNTLKSVRTEPSGRTYTTTYKNKYNKEGYLTEAKAYEDGKLVWRDVYKYTSKTYTVDE